MTLTEFLLARIAEDEAVARDDQCRDPWIETGPADGVYFIGSDDRGGTYLATTPDRVLAECEAKRRTLEVARLFGCEKTVARYLALPYADHPDYQQEWRVAGE